MPCTYNDIKIKELALNTTKVSIVNLKFFKTGDKNLSVNYRGTW